MWYKHHSFVSAGFPILFSNICPLSTLFLTFKFLLIRGCLSFLSTFICPVASPFSPFLPIIASFSSSLNSSSFCSHPFCSLDLSIPYAIITKFECIIANENILCTILSKNFLYTIAIESCLCNVAIANFLFTIVTNASDKFYMVHCN